MNPAEPAPKRALGYISTASRQHVELAAQAREQRRRIAELASAKGLELVDVVHEPRVRDPVTSAERPVLFDLLERARSGEFDVLILGTRVGLSNESFMRAFLERRLQHYGVELESADGGDCEPSIDVAHRILSAIEGLERAVLVTQLRVGKAEKKARGRHVHGRVPYGFRSEKGVLHPIETRARIVSWIFSEAAAGRSPGQIARGLNQEGVPPPQRGKAWSEQGVRVILGNPAYMGERYGVKDAHPALIRPRLWQAAQEALEARRRT